jgi:hypothetical protein
MLKPAATAGLMTLMLILATVATAGEKHHKAAKVDSPAFEQFKQLAGEWVGASDKPGHEGGGAVFKVTSAGSAVEETMMPGTPYEMVNMIHPDGEDIVLTHYCAEGNQPEM